MRVVAGGIIHDKMWVLPYYLKALAEVRGISGIVFLANNCSQEEIAMLTKYGVVNIDNSMPSTAERTSDRSKSLAYYRNRFLDIVFGELGADGLLSLDSDVIVLPETLEDLLYFDKDIISCLLWNDLHFGSEHGHIGNIMRFKGNRFEHIRDPELNRLIECDLTGAVYYISRKVYDAGVRYAPNRQGEDAGFCIHAKEKGFAIFCHTRLVDHLMTPKVLAEWLTKNNI